MLIVNERERNNILDIRILYEDNHLLIVEKPVNIPVQEDRSKDIDLLTTLKNDLKVRHHKPGNVYLALVHRLDRPVGGAIVFAKTSKAASRLANELRKQQIKREYLAVVRGHLNKEERTLTHYLWKDRRKNKVYTVNKSKRGAKKAVLTFNVIEHLNDELTLIRVRLQTGRSHQIRVQLSEIGHPLYGDQKYGRYLNKAGEQIALWSHELSFKHPTKDEVIRMQSKPPQTYPWTLFSNITFN